MKHTIVINPHTIQFSFMGKIVYTIWEEEYDEVIKAIESSKKYKTELKELEAKYGN